MKTLILLMAVLTSFIANAYEPMIREDRIWEYQKTDVNLNNQELPETIHIYQFRFEGTRNINNTSYNVLKMQIKDSDSPWEEVALMREDVSEGIVYVLLDQNSVSYEVLGECKEFPIPENYEVPLYRWDLGESSKENIVHVQYYDYGGFPTDMITELNDSPYSISLFNVLFNKTVTLNGRELKYAAYSNMIDDPDYSIDKEVVIAIVSLEGVGNVSSGFLHKPIIPLVSNGFTYTTVKFLRQTDVWGTVIIEAPDKWDTNSVETVNVESRPADERKYNLQGVETDRPEPGSIYIQNGEKHVAN